MLPVMLATCLRVLQHHPISSSGWRQLIITRYSDICSSFINQHKMDIPTTLIRRFYQYKTILKTIPSLLHITLLYNVMSWSLPWPVDNSFRIVQGRTATSLNALHAGYINGKDGKLLVSGKHAWRCIKGCKGRFYTLSDSTPEVICQHTHSPTSPPLRLRLLSQK